VSCAQATAAARWVAAVANHEAVERVVATGGANPDAPGGGDNGGGAGAYDDDDIHTRRVELCHALRLELAAGAQLARPDAGALRLEARARLLARIGEAVELALTRYDAVVALAGTMLGRSRPACVACDRPLPSKQRRPQSSPGGGAPDTTAAAHAARATAAKLERAEASAETQDASRVAQIVREQSRADAQRRAAAKERAAESALHGQLTRAQELLASDMRPATPVPLTIVGDLSHTVADRDFAPRPASPTSPVWPSAAPLSPATLRATATTMAYDTTCAAYDHTPTADANRTMAATIAATTFTDDAPSRAMAVTTCCAGV